MTNSSQEMADVESGIPKVQQEPSEALRIVVENTGAENVPKDEPSVSSSERVDPTIEELEQPRQDDVESSSAKVSICRIPHYLQDGDEKAYVPQIVSLGPYHQGGEHLRLMEQHKLRCLHQILERSHHEKCLYLDSVKEVEQRARACYEGTIFMSSDDFVQMMVLDGCFVIELFRGVDEGFEKLGYPCNDPVFSKWGSMLNIQIQRDMILLENQIPLFILDRLLSLQLGVPYQKGRVVKLALQFFSPLTQISGDMVKSDSSSDQCGLHCLDVFWRSLLPSGLYRVRTQGWRQNRQHLMRCVTVLREAGIKLCNRYTNTLGDIKFNLEDGILQIPRLGIHEGTRSLFLNLIAFERSHFDCSNDVTSYVIFMHNLIDSPEDVEYLRNRGIIDHCLGSDAEVADLFNRLCQGVAFDVSDSYLFRLSLDVKYYCDWGSPLFHRAGRGRGVRIAMFCELVFRFLAHQLARKWRAWVAVLKNKYFDNPWSIISLIAAFILLVLTFLQALYAVYGYYMPRS
ncbi:UPF0481 protein At3g47200-like [Syzygium oleosum]|uniref:UPF0481 protein At3g47200-like n=1 Tax=Syzygium oleosum TaxID=219896 RepID=UPI0024B98D30|nr:UPF0481 protein At3g47200-like [Syzygium oleosum]